MVPSGFCMLDQHFAALSRGEEIIIPKFEFARQMRNDSRGTPLKLGVTHVEGHDAERRGRTAGSERRCRQKIEQSFHNFIV